MQPFNNVVREDVHGPQIDDVLEQQFGILRRANSGCCGLAGHVLVDAVVPVGRRSTSRRSRSAEPSWTAAPYRVVMNNFIADGGDGFSVFRRARLRSAATWTSTRSRGT